MILTHPISTAGAPQGSRYGSSPGAAAGGLARQLQVAQAADMSLERMSGSSDMRVVDVGTLPRTVPLRRPEPIGSASPPDTVWRYRVDDRPAMRGAGMSGTDRPAHWHELAAPPSPAATAPLSFGAGGAASAPASRVVTPVLARRMRRLSSESLPDWHDTEPGALLDLDSAMPSAPTTPGSDAATSTRFLLPPREDGALDRPWRIGAVVSSPPEPAQGAHAGPAHGLSTSQRIDLNKVPNRGGADASEQASTSRRAVRHGSPTCASDRFGDMDELPSAEAYELPVWQIQRSGETRQSRMRARTGSQDMHAPMRRHLRQILAAHCGTPRSSEVLESLVHSRYIALLRMGETAESLAEQFDKAQAFDQAANLAVGAALALPFAMASCVLQGLPLPAAFTRSAFARGFSSGLIAGAFETVGAALLAPGLRDAEWLAADVHELEAAIVELLHRRQDSVRQRALLNALAIQPYALRDLMRALLAWAMRSSAPAHAETVDLLLSIGGGVLAGAASRWLRYRLACRTQRVGAAYLLAHRELEPRYRMLRRTDWRRQMRRGGERVRDMPRECVLRWREALSALFDARQWLRNCGILAFGFASTTSTCEALARWMRAKDFEEGDIAAAQRTLYVPLCVMLFGVWAASDAIVPPLRHRVSR